MLLICTVYLIRITFEQEKVTGSAPSLSSGLFGPCIRLPHKMQKQEDAVAYLLAGIVHIQVGRKYGRAVLALVSETEFRECTRVPVNLPTAEPSGNKVVLVRSHSFEGLTAWLSFR